MMSRSGSQGTEVTIVTGTFSTPQGAFTPDANDANRANDLHVKSMQRRERPSCGAIRTNEAARMARIELNCSEFHA